MSQGYSDSRNQKKKGPSGPYWNLAGKSGLEPLTGRLTALLQPCMFFSVTICTEKGALIEFDFGSIPRDRIARAYSKILLAGISVVKVESIWAFVVSAVLALSAEVLDGHELQFATVLGDGLLQVLGTINVCSCHHCSPALPAELHAKSLVDALGNDPSGPLTGDLQSPPAPYGTTHPTGRECSTTVWGRQSEGLGKFISWVRW